MNMDSETWLINEGDRIIKQQSRDGYESLSALEKTIYCLWIVDYAVRNSGTLQPMRDLHNNSISELMRFAKENNCSNLCSMLELSNDETLFCENFYQNFENVCEDLR